MARRDGAMPSPIAAIDPIDVRDTLRAAGLRARHALSQNFLADPDVLTNILAEADPEPGGGVLEIGPGLGFLTGGLLAHGAAVTAVELDAGLVAFVRDRFSPEIADGQLRIIDGDALDVVVRKAVASAETIISPLGIGSLVIGIPLWILIFRYALPVLEQEFTTLRPCLQSILITGVLGTLLNDGGSSVWLSVTAVVTLSMAWFLVAAAARDGWTVTELRAIRR